MAKEPYVYGKRGRIALAYLLIRHESPQRDNTARQIVIGMQPIKRRNVVHPRAYLRGLGAEVSVQWHQHPVSISTFSTVGTLVYIHMYRDRGAVPGALVYIHICRGAYIGSIEIFEIFFACEPHWQAHI